jgi:hypothetical protein
MIESLLLLLGLMAVGAVILIFARSIATRHDVGLRPLSAYQALSTQVGRAVESGRRVHLALGRGSLSGPAGPTSVAALTILDHLAGDATASGAPPVVTVGDATLLPAAQDTLRSGYEQARRRADYNPTQVHFLAAESRPFAYGGGAGDTLHRPGIGSNLMVGRFGAELAVMAEAAARADMQQVAGSDDPLALSLAVATTGDVLIGEELLASGAYLQGRPSQLASLQIQDLLRAVIILAVLLAALYRLVVPG